MATLFSPLTEIPPNARPIPVPIINVYTQQPGQWERERNPYSEAREEEVYTGPPSVCWADGTART